MKNVNCFECKHFKTTWNPVFPRACQAYGFKTKEMPSNYVLKTTGTSCLQFEPKRAGNSAGQGDSQSKIDFRL
ncbi:uracil-DNA glycosylase [Halobacillus fulvus]|nr:uracil-DNA glycosylase [Halobacillus fulvus]